LRDKQFMARKRDDEQTLRASVDADPEKRKKFGKVWDDVAAAYQRFQPYYKEYSLTTVAFCELCDIARNVLRLPEEMQKPSDQRLREYRDSALPSLNQQIYSTAPISDSLQIAMIAENFRFMQRQLGPDNELVKKVWPGKLPSRQPKCT